MKKPILSFNQWLGIAMLVMTGLGTLTGFVLCLPTLYTITKGAVNAPAQLSSLQEKATSHDARFAGIEAKIAIIPDMQKELHDLWLHDCAPAGYTEPTIPILASNVNVKLPNAIYGPHGTGSGSSTGGGTGQLKPTK